jgi:2-oxoglutarate dehydrogenase E1 component
LRNYLRNAIRWLPATHVFDWAMGEQLAYGTLLLAEGKRVRLSGQDVKRGTFSHRHAVLTLEDSEEEYTPLSQYYGSTGDSLISTTRILSEYGVLGFRIRVCNGQPKCTNHLGSTIW